MALSARTKLFGGFGVGILAVLIAVIVGITQIRTADGKADGLYNDSLEQTSRTATLRRDMLQMRVSILQYVLSPADKRADFGAKIKTFQDAISTDLENLRGEKLTAAQTEQLTAAEESITAWYEARDKGPIGKTDAGDSAGATQAALYLRHHEHALGRTMTPWLVFYTGANPMATGLWREDFLPKDLEQQAVGRAPDHAHQSFRDIAHAAGASEDSPDQY